ncbi:MAG: hypothetical protein ACRDRN_01065 [Sciscionella sp.]
MTDADSIIRKADDKLREIEQKTQDLFDRVNGILDWVPSFLSDVVHAIQTALNMLKQKLDEFWSNVNQFITEPGSLSALQHAADAWEKSVSATISSLAGTLTLGQLRTDDKWHGPAATAYKTTVPAQAAALNAIKDIADQANTSLTNLKGAVLAFWVAIAAAVVTFVIGLIAAIAQCCTIVDIPGGVATAAAAAAVVIGLIVAAVTALTSYVNIINSEQASMVQKLDDNSKFPNGTWPVSTADIGDDSGWHVNS